MAESICTQSGDQLIKSFYGNTITSYLFIIIPHYSRLSLMYMQAKFRQDLIYSQAKRQKFNAFFPKDIEINANKDLRQ